MSSNIQIAIWDLEQNGYSFISIRLRKNFFMNIKLNLLQSTIWISRRDLPQALNFSKDLDVF